MITDVYIVYNKYDDIVRFGDALKVSPFLHFIDERTKDGRKNAFALKGHWGARLTPFAICFDGEKAVKAFYTESDDDIIKSLVEYINENISIG